MCRKPMLLLASFFDGVPTFRLVSLCDKSPFIEMIYDPCGRMLIVVPRLFGKLPPGMPRPMLYYHDFNQIVELIQQVCYNADEFDYRILLR